eukprot:TRINITY_DN9995_c0_g1_i1.p1 TRINITY_DN9995_c0_g1~~TRINITY_DN9995_c0_g1_i1.p1  ORF type:complete len:119 (-),score=16.77 TRINITY_DN9995_c0_g1_i1:42-398(-)
MALYVQNIADLPEYSYTLRAAKGFNTVCNKFLDVKILHDFMYMDEHCDIHCCFIMEVPQSKKLLECFKKYMVWNRVCNKMKLKFRPTLGGEFVHDLVSFEFNSQVLFFINECLSNAMY